MTPSRMGGTLWIILGFVAVCATTVVLEGLCRRRLNRVEARLDRDKSALENAAILEAQLSASMKYTQILLCKITLLQELESTNRIDRLAILDGMAAKIQDSLASSADTVPDDVKEAIGAMNLLIEQARMPRVLRTIPIDAGREELPFFVRRLPAGILGKYVAIGTVMERLALSLQPYLLKSSYELTARYVSRLSNKTAVNSVMGDHKVIWKGYVENSPRNKVGDFIMRPGRGIAQEDLRGVTAKVTVPQGLHGLDNKWFQVGQLVEVKGLCNYDQNEFILIASDICAKAE